MQLSLMPFDKLQSVIGTVLQEANEFLDFVKNMEDVAPARHAGQCQRLAAQAQARVGDGGIGSEALIDQLQQAHAQVSASR